MNVFFPNDNGRFAQYTLRKVGDWAAGLPQPEIHVIHWNNGLWDVMHLPLSRAVHDGEAAGLTAEPEKLASDHFRGGSAVAAAHCGKLHRDWVHYDETGSGLLADEIVGFLEKENLL